MESSNDEYIVPLTKAIHLKKSLIEEQDDGFPFVTGASYCLRPHMVFSEIKEKLVLNGL